MTLTVVEALARFRAQRRADQTDATERSAHASRADTIASHAAARVTWTPALDNEWLHQASPTDIGQAWAAATTWTDTDPEAWDAGHRCQVRLHELYPDAMTAYTAARAEGLDPSAAMSRATDQLTQGAQQDPVATPSSGPRPPQDVAADGYPLPASHAVKTAPRSGNAHVITTVPARDSTRATTASRG